MIYKPRHFMTPVAVDLVKVTDGREFAGYWRLYIFGWCVAQIQLTKPWED